MILFQSDFNELNFNQLLKRKMYHVVCFEDVIDSQETNVTYTKGQTINT